MKIPHFKIALDLIFSKILSICSGIFEVLCNYINISLVLLLQVKLFCNLKLYFKVLYDFTMLFHPFFPPLNRLGAISTPSK